MGYRGEGYLDGGIQMRGKYPEGVSRGGYPDGKTIEFSDL